MARECVPQHARTRRGQAVRVHQRWNEWAEGAHLEPDRAHGYAYLQATADALRKFPQARSEPSIVVVSHDAYFHGAQHLALQLTKTLSTALGYNVEVLLCGPG